MPLSNEDLTSIQGDINTILLASLKGSVRVFSSIFSALHDVFTKQASPINVTVDSLHPNLNVIVELEELEESDLAIEVDPDEETRLESLPNWEQYSKGLGGDPIVTSTLAARRALADGYSQKAIATMLNSNDPFAFQLSQERGEVAKERYINTIVRHAVWCFEQARKPNAVSPTQHQETKVTSTRRR